ncbi:MAG: hypothetical protein D6690_16595 [Nitrospirae bacterium]|nr:MAG: hypothetical protein D6690_16595 [Nitrospirota bacterium]
MIVLEGLKGQAMADLRTAPQVSHAHYDKRWRVQVLAHARRASEASPLISACHPGQLRMLST